MTGQLFGDRYQVGDTLGFGGMSEVHRGRDLRLGRDVAIKVLRADLARDPSFQVRFRREAQNAASLNHPAIVAVYDTGETPAPAGGGGAELGKIPYIVMEYVDGETLRELLKREGTLAPKRAMEITADVCAALDFSHRHGIVHRDVKPANIMLTLAGAVKVMDFGIARAVADGQSSMTATAAVIGTAQYLSPEQARGEAVDARSDVYSTGCVLYELLTGAPPFTGDSPVAVAYQHVREDPKPLSVAKPGLPRELDAIVLKALNKNPLNRYQTAAEMRSDLVRALSGQAVLAPRVMDDAERTEIMGASAGRGGASASRSGAMVAQRPTNATPPILAPPQRIAAEQMWDDEPEQPKKKLWGYVGIGALCLLLLAGAVMLTIRFTSAPPPPANVAVPDVSKMTQEQATAELVKFKLKLAPGEPDTQASSDEDKGKVVWQNPSGGTSVAPDSAVAIKLGAGVTAVEVPKLLGADKAKADADTKNANLVPAFKMVKSTRAQLDLVIKQTPAAGTKAKPGTKIVIELGRGPDYATLPDPLKGKKLTEAQALLTAAHLKATVEYRPDLAEKDNVVDVKDVPSDADTTKPGVQVLEDSPIKLIVSDGSLFTMPDVAVNRPDVQGAVDILKGAGWQGSGADGVEVEYVESFNESEWGRIVNQEPAAGTAFGKLRRPTLKQAYTPERSVPQLEGLTVAEGNARMAANQFFYPLSASPVANNDPNLTGKIRDVSPGSGTTQKINVTVSVTYYDSPPVVVPPKETTPAPKTPANPQPSQPPANPEPSQPPANPEPSQPPANPEPSQQASQPPAATNSGNGGNGQPSPAPSP